MGDAAFACLGVAPPPPPPPPPPVLRQRPADELRIHVGVPIAPTGVDLLVAAATLQVFEIQDAAMVAEDEGDEFDPSTDCGEGIFGSYGLMRRDSDGARPFWLCGTPHRGFSERDILRAIKRMGHFGGRLEPIYSCESPMQSTENLHTDDLAHHADELGVLLPRDAHARIRALVAKHLPRPKYLESATAAMKRLERAAAEFNLTYESPRKRLRTPAV